MTDPEATQLQQYLGPVDEPVHQARRRLYAAAIRIRIKADTIPPAFPWGRPAGGATEYDLADAVLAVHDTELTHAHAERDAALHLAQVWGDAPDPICRGMAADLRSAIRSARPSTAPRLLDCGLCYEEAGKEAHPHPECLVGTSERARLQRAVDVIRDFNQLTVDHSCRVQAVQHARDNLALLDQELTHSDVPDTSNASSARANRIGETHA